MQNTSQEDLLDQQLREATPYIDDAGFTRGVMAKLPAPRRQRWPVRATILIGLTILGSVMAYVISGGGRFLVQELMHLAALPIWWVLLTALSTGVLIAVLGFAAALFKSRELQS
jgi:hypothetical protein